MTRRPRDRAIFHMPTTRDSDLEAGELCKGPVRRARSQVARYPLEVSEEKVAAITLLSGVSASMTAWTSNVEWRECRCPGNPV